MRQLPTHQIQRLHKAVLSAGLPGSREPLLGGIDPALVARLPSAQDPSGQILSDLHELNAIPTIEGETAPLRVWLENAASLASPRIETKVFREVLALLDAAPAEARPDGERGRSRDAAASTLSVPKRRLRARAAPSSPLVFWVVVQLPVVGGALATLLDKGPADWIKAHLVAATFITLAYEAVAGVSKKVWTRLEPEVTDALTGLIRGTFLSLMSPFRRRYLKKVIHEHRTFNVRGLREQGAFTIQLERVFVELRIAPNSAQQATFDPLGGKELSGNRPVWDFLRMVASEEAVALSILGPPGSGKTTLLQHIALTMAAHQQRRHRLRAYLPLFLFLRDHAATIAAPKPPSLGALAQAFFRRRPGLPPPPPRWFERQLQAGACIVLLDGLDEVADEKHRALVSAWVEEQITAYPRCPFILTARPLGYRTAPLKRAHVLEVQPFGADQVRRFIHNWYLANEIMRAGGQDDEGVREEASARAEDLLQRLRQRPALGDLTKNPLLLTMIATVHSTRNALPGRRVQLYAEICEVLLGHWRMAKGLATPLTSDQIRVALEPLAAHMMRERKREAPVDEALAVMKTPLTEIGVTGQAVNDFLPTLQASSGLILEREQGRWGFAHLTFQEYLAASHFRKQGVELAWRPLIQDGWWHETLRLYAAQGDASDLLQNALTLDEVPALALASECLEEALKINEAVRAQAEERLTAALESDDPERRRLAAEVRLACRLRALQHIDDRREIDLGYITCAEYQIYLDEARVQGRFLQPDHWTAYQFPAAQAREPVLGVRFDDAKAFAEWLTERRRDGWTYRLPTVDEATEHPAVESPLQAAAWCGLEDDRRLVGASQEAVQAVLEGLRSLSSLPLPSSITQKLDLAPFFDLAGDVMRARLEVALDRGLVDLPGLGKARNRDRDLKSAPDHLRDIASAWAAARARHRILHSASGNVGVFANARSVKPALQSVPKHAVSIAAALDRVRGLADALTSAPRTNEALATVRRVAQVLTQIRDRADPRVGRPGSPGDFTRAHDRKSVPDHVRTLSHAVATVEGISLKISKAISASDIDEAVPFHNSEIVSRVLDLAGDLVRARDRVVVHALDATTRASIFGDPRAHAFQGILDKTRVNKVAFTLAGAHDGALTLADADADGLDEAHAEVHAFVYSSFSRNIRVEREMDAKLFDSLIALLCADSPETLRRARRNHAACFTEYIWTISEKLAFRVDPPWYRPLASRGADAEGSFARQRETILELHWWFQALMARTEGMLPVWEGIRLVRERRP